MRKKSHSAMRRQGFILPPLKTVSLRIQTDLWERCGWAAAALKVDRSSFVRDTLEDATKNAKPLVPLPFTGIAGTAEQRAQWERAAKLVEKPIGEFAAESLDYVSGRILRPKPATDAENCDG